MQEQINNSSMLKVGTILRGTYHIDSYLSSGGFGNTYVATNIEFDERVAIKEFFMKGITQRDENQTTVSVSNTENHNSFIEQKEKFKKEARRIRQLKNGHIVAVHDLFEENGTAYYVMDYVDGENLAERLKRTGKPMMEQEVREFLPQILDALKTVHDTGIWHLDLKPANVMIDKNGCIKLIDFGASKQLNSQKGGATTSTAISYTNGYAPREQMEQNYDKFGPWTDIYALGATIYTLLANKRPPLPTDIDDDTSEDKHKTLPMPENTSEEMKSLILWMMQTNRNRRPKDVNSVLSKLTSSNYTIIEDEIDESTIVERPYNNINNNSSNSFPRGQKRYFKYFIGFSIVLSLCVFIGVMIIKNYNPNEKLRYKPRYKVINEKEKTCELFGSTPKGEGLNYYLSYRHDNIACIPTKANGEYDIPEYVDGFKVIKIGDYSFCNTKLSTINVPEGVKTIGNFAFSESEKLSNLFVSDGVESIGSCCFMNDSLLTEVVLPESIISIGRSAFSGCKSLKQIKLPRLLTIIPKSLFCNSGISSLELPNSILKIDSAAFERCKSLTSITIPEGVEEISEGAFIWCDSLTSVYLPSTIKRIKPSVFFGCSLLSSIIIPEGIEEISLSAFDNTSLTSLHLPKTIKTIEGFFPANSKRLKTIISDIPDPFVVNYPNSYRRFSPDSYLNGPKDVVLYVPHGAKDLYIKAGWDRHFAKIIER